MAVQTTSVHGAFGGKQIFCEHASEIVGGPMKVSIYLPPNAGTAKVPVLYYLAGLTCTEETFAAKGGAQRFAGELGLAIVTCDTSPRHARYPGDDASWDFGQGAGFYVDATEAPWSATYRMYSYVKQELPAFVAQSFPIDPSRQGIFGHSMGGHGALVLGLRNPDRFKSVSAFAPIVSPSTVPWGKKAFTGYLGEDEAAWQAYDACALVRKKPIASRILVDQGTSDKFLERELQPERFEEACAASGQALELRRHAGYDHGYYFISTFVESHLRHHAGILLA